MTTPSPFSQIIPRRSPRCVQNQEVLVPGADYYSVISEDDNGAFVRKDFCVACWEASAKQECLKEAKGYWKSKVPAKQIEPQRSQNREILALDLLRQALTRNTPEDQAEAFILALYLVRKRMIYMRQQLQQADGQVVTFYEVADNEEMLAVRKFPLSQLEIVTLQQRLAEKLRNGKCPT